MTDLLFFDTNVLIYSLDPTDSVKRRAAAHLIDHNLDTARLVTSVQSLNECYRVLTGRRKFVPPHRARSFVESLMPTCRAPLTTEAIRLAWTIEDETGYSWWDSLLVSSALLAHCNYFLSEDMADGHVIRGMMVVNPFAPDILPFS